LVCHLAYPLGSIPACAGEPGLPPLRPLWVGVYPRVCGGAVPMIHEGVSARGLSPRVRGSLTPTRTPGKSSGSIPACAGEPAGPLFEIVRRRVYPRVCGGADPRREEILMKSGLSPRVRGSPRDQAIRVIRQRSIPACAGEPQADGKPATALGVYPRVCGGALSDSSGHLNHSGLSPRVRGSRLLVVGKGLGQGSIPACAGEPRRIARMAACSWVYPRVCGGAGAPFSFRIMNSGLSPRVRGSLLFLGDVDRGGGSIPACAGEPI